MRELNEEAQQIKEQSLQVHQHLQRLKEQSRDLNSSQARLLEDLRGVDLSSVQVRSSSDFAVASACCEAVGIDYFLMNWLCPDSAVFCSQRPNVPSGCSCGYETSWKGGVPNYQMDQMQADDVGDAINVVLFS